MDDRYEQAATTGREDDGVLLPALTESVLAASIKKADDQYLTCDTKRMMAIKDLGMKYNDSFRDYGSDIGPNEITPSHSADPLDNENNENTSEPLYLPAAGRKQKSLKFLGYDDSRCEEPQKNDTLHSFHDDRNINDDEIVARLLMESHKTKLEGRVEETVNFLIREQLRVEETRRIANRLIGDKQEYAALADIESKELHFLRSEQELERNLLLQRQQAEAREAVERFSAEVQREEGLEKLEAKELKLHQLQRSYDITMSFRRQMQHKRDNFQELTKNRLERERQERRQLALSQQRARENTIVVQEVMASHMESEKKRSFMKECKLAAQQLVAMQRRESEQFHEIQALKNKMNQEAFDDETRAMEERHSMTVNQRMEVESMQASHIEEVRAEKRRARKNKQELDAMMSKRRQQQESRIMLNDQELRIQELTARQERKAVEKREILANQIKNELQEFQEQFKGINIKETASKSSGATTPSNVSDSEANRSNFGGGNEEYDLRNIKLDDEEVAKRKMLKEKQQKEDDALFKNQKVLNEQRIEESEKRLSALKKQQEEAEEQLLKRHDEKIKLFDETVAEASRAKQDENEKIMLRVRSAHAKERTEIDASHEREMAAFKKAEQLNSQLRQQAVEAANNASKSKGDFLAFVCHELRNPLHGMVAIVDLIMEDDAIELQEVRENLLHLRQQTDLMSEIVNDVLDLSKIESGKLDLSFVDFDVKMLVKSIAHDQELVLQKMGKDVQVITKIADDVPITIWGEPVRWRQILLNIISNACKFTQQGSITLEVDILPKDPESGRIPVAKGQYNADRESPQTIRVKVIDTGIGISDEEIPKLFKAFSQAQPHVARKYGGTGIGLSICKALTDQMKGTIGVSSKVGIGSTFTFTLPIQARDNTNADDFSFVGETRRNGGMKMPNLINKNVKKELNLSRLKGLRILVVDDIQLNCKLAVRRFGKAGANVDVACNGKELLDKVLPTMDPSTEKPMFDIILTDVNMPIMKGDEATRILRSKGYNGVIIGLTGSATQIEKEQYLKAGMTMVLVKPYHFEDLAESIIKSLAMK